MSCRHALQAEFHFWHEGLTSNLRCSYACYVQDKSKQIVMPVSFLTMHAEVDTHEAIQ